MATKAVHVDRQGEGVGRKYFGAFSMSGIPIDLGRNFKQFEAFLGFYRGFVLEGSKPGQIAHFVVLFRLGSNSDLLDCLCKGVKTAALKC